MKKAKDLTIQAMAAALGASLGVLIASLVFAPRKTKKKSLEIAETLHSVRPTAWGFLVVVRDLIIIAIAAFRLRHHLREFCQFIRHEWEHYRTSEDTFR